MSLHDATLERHRAAIRAVLDMADSNFPVNTSVTITANGPHSASVTVPVYVLQDMLKEQETTIDD